MRARHGTARHGKVAPLLFATRPSGAPFWYRFGEYQADCAANWWRNLLFVNNFRAVECFDHGTTCVMLLLLLRALLHVPLHILLHIL